MNEHDQNIDNLSVDPNAILYSMINSLSDKVRDLEKENALLKAEIDQLKNKKTTNDSLFL